MIRRDIARTYPEVDFFKEKDGPGQEALFNVIKAYSLHDREVGYCQGSGFIVGLLLMQMPEEEAFAVLVQIMQQHRMRDMFKPSMSELGLCMYQLESLVQEQIPEMHIHFQQQVNTRNRYDFCLKDFSISIRCHFIYNYTGFSNHHVCFQLVSYVVYYIAKLKYKLSHYGCFP